MAFDIVIRAFYEPEDERVPVQYEVAIKNHPLAVTAPKRVGYTHHKPHPGEQDVVAFIVQNELSRPEKEQVRQAVRAWREKPLDAAQPNVEETS